MKTLLLSVHVLLVFVVSSQTVTAQTLSIYSFANNRILSNDNGSNAYYGDAPGIVGLNGRYRAVTRFDLSAITSTIVGATLEIGLVEIINGVGLTIWDTNASLNPPVNQWSSSAAALWTDTGTGDWYGGSNFIHTGLNSFTLNNFALADINAAVGNSFALGLTATNDSWDFASIYWTKLDLQVAETISPMATPEPSSLFLLGSSLLVSLCYKVRRSKKK